MADLSISAATDLAASGLTLPRSSNQNGNIPENQTFQQALDSASDKHDTPEKISGVAKQFEALMIGQILKTARESSGGGWLSDEDSQDDQTGSLVMEMAEQSLSQALAARGGLGIAKMVTTNMERGESKTPSSDSEAPLSGSSLSGATSMDLKRSSLPLVLPPAAVPLPERTQRPER
jgi:Rod binding domain-containing protein